LRNKLALAVIAVLSLIAAPSLFAWTVTVSTYKSISGVDYAQSAGSMYFKLCNTTNGYCYQSLSEGNGVGWTDAPEGTYYAYIWDGAGNWGSTDIPNGGWSETWTVYATPYGQYISLSAYPRPLMPGLVAPCNYCGVGQGNFDLVWTNGLDNTRTAANWTVTYDIWDSATPVGWQQGTEHLAITDAPCNPDAQGNCHWYVDYLDYSPGCQYTWRIVVKINFGNGQVYTTSGPSWHLHQNY
jgi:hypothetical protein